MEIYFINLLSDWQADPPGSLETCIPHFQNHGLDDSPGQEETCLSSLTFQ